MLLSQSILKNYGTGNISCEIRKTFYTKQKDNFHLICDWKIFCWIMLLSLNNYLLNIYIMIEIEFLLKLLKTCLVELSSKTLILKGTILFIWDISDNLGQNLSPKAIKINFVKLFDDNNQLWNDHSKLLIYHITGCTLCTIRFLTLSRSSQTLTLLLLSSGTDERWYRFIMPKFIPCGFDYWLRVIHTDSPTVWTQTRTKWFNVKLLSVTILSECTTINF